MAKIVSNRSGASLEAAFTVCYSRLTGDAGISHCNGSGQKLRTVPPGSLAPAQGEQQPASGMDTIPLPPAPHRLPAAPEHHGRHSRVDLALAVLVLSLAFLAASFPARNSDLWFHLATGRRLAQGQYTFGTDPF